MPGNRSLERGIEVLRAFRPGSELLGNGELAERTGLPRSTISRLTQTLVGSGLLLHEPSARAYRLAPAVLSLAHAMRAGSRVLAIAAPLMRKVAESAHVNVGLAAPDRADMVYLESIRYASRVAFRNVVSGQRVPMELTSLGRAYLAVLPEDSRASLMKTFRMRRRALWPTLRPAIDAAIGQVGAQGYCAASWQPEVLAVATPLMADDAYYVLNMSVSSSHPAALLEAALAPRLLTLRRDIEHELLRSVPA